MKDSLRKTWLQYEAGKDYKRKIGLYSTIRENERFYRGEHWYGVASNNLPRPVFNVVKRITDYLVCALTPEKISIKYLDESLPYIKDGESRAASSKIVDILNLNARYRWERSKMDSKLYSLCLDAAITGDGVLYSYWKNDAVGDGNYEGDIQTEIIDNANIFVADVNKNDIQGQDYIILSGRASVVSLKREAKENGVSEEQVLKIVPDGYSGDERSSDYSDIELEGDEEAKTTYLIKFWREDGFVCFEKSTKDCVIKRAKTPCKLYPIAHFNWHSQKNSFHGMSAVSGMISNQKYINRAYAMVMKHMSDTAFSKVIYDKSKIPEWSNEVGEAIGAMGTANVSDAVTVLGVGKLQDKYLDFLENVIEVTKELSGATETALGNINPINTSAILAIMEASKTPLKLIRCSLYQCIEDLANIWADMMLGFYCEERLISMLDENGERKSESFGAIVPGDKKFRAIVDIIDSNAYNLSVSVSVLDKLLEGGHISAEQYLGLLPSEYVGDIQKKLGGEKYA